MKQLIKSFNSNFWLIFVLLIAFILRLPHLNDSFWLDEAAQALESSRPLNQQLNIADDFQPPLLHLIVHFLIQISPTEWWLRFIAALIPAMITIWATYQIAFKIANREVAVLSSLLLASSSLHIYFSQELRPYSLSVMFAVLSILILVKAFQIKTRSYYQLYLLLIIFNTLGLYTSYLYLFFLLAELSYLFILLIEQYQQFNNFSLWSANPLQSSKNRFYYQLLTKKKVELNFQQKKINRLMRLIFASLISFFLFLPWLPFLFHQIHSGTNLRVNLPGWDQVVSYPQLKALILVIAKFVYGIIDIKINQNFIFTSITVFLLLIILLIAFCSNCLLIKEKKPYIKHLFLILILCCLSIPLFSSYLFSFWLPIIQPKRLLYLLPFFDIILALIVIYPFQKRVLKEHWPCIIRKPLASLLCLTLFSLNIYGTYHYYVNPQYQRENWRSLFNQINANYDPQNTILIFSFNQPFAPWIWYSNHQYPTYSFGQYHVDQVANLKKEVTIINSYQNVLLFDYLRDLTDPEDKLIKEIEALGYTGQGVIDYPNIGFVRIYHK